MMMMMILVLFCLVVLSMNDFRPNRGVCPMVFLLQDNNSRAVTGTACCHLAAAMRQESQMVHASSESSEARACI